MASLDTFIEQKCVKMLLVLAVGILMGAFLSFAFLGALGALLRPVVPCLFTKCENKNWISLLVTRRCAKAFLFDVDTYGCEEGDPAAGAGGVGNAAVKTWPFPVNLEVASKGVCILS